MKFKIITTTTDLHKIARNIATVLVRNKLSPCVQIIPQIESIYNWMGKIKNSNEFLLIIKTKLEHVEECKNYVLKLHNYDIPEMIVTEGEILLDTYSDWFVGK